MPTFETAFSGRNPIHTIVLIESDRMQSRIRIGQIKGGGRLRGRIIHREQVVDGRVYGERHLHHGIRRGWELGGRLARFLSVGVTVVGLHVLQHHLAFWMPTKKFNFREFMREN